MPIFTKNSGTWKIVKPISLKIGGTWRNIKQIWHKDSGIWKPVYKSAIELVISSNVSNYNLFAAAGSPSSPIDIFLTINAGVLVSSTSPSVAAFDTGNFPVGSSITIINNGSIIGKGGNGGAGSQRTCANRFTCVTGSGGQNGGMALRINSNITLDNTNGNIFGGGGGGGGGGSSATGTVAAKAFLGGGGGGGAGSNGGSGGPRGRITNAAEGSSCGGGAIPDIWGDAGQAGNTSGGAGGAGGQGDGTGKGGNGGAYGQNGQVGAGGSVGFLGCGSGTSPAGLAGKAININGNSIIWLGGNNGTQVKGSVA